MKLNLIMQTQSFFVLMNGARVVCSHGKKLEDIDGDSMQDKGSKWNKKSTRTSDGRPAPTASDVVVFEARHNYSLQSGIGLW